MEEIKQLSDDVYEQIKDFMHGYLTEEQELLINKLILDDELKECYKKNGLCGKCKQPKTNYDWCRMCNVKHFQQNFKNWTSGNDDVDKFIQKSQLKAKSEYEILEWIEHDRFKNIEYLAEGGFGAVYKAIWRDGYIREWDSKNNQWERRENYKVALKCLHNSRNITDEFLKEVELFNLISQGYLTIIRCYGITKDPKTNNFMMIMDYADNGSLRQHLNISISLNWTEKLDSLWYIVEGLKVIHEKGLIHHDFHCGNILIKGQCFKHMPMITDLGLCRPANATSQSDDKQIYGVLPYVAPEVLRGKEYTQAGDIYGFGIIAYELCTGLPPYHDISHDESLAINICQGLRPKSNYKIPQLILDIIQRCWDADPLNRPKADELSKLFKDLHYKSNKSNEYYYDKNSIINKQIKEADEINEELPKTSSSTGVLSYTTHTQAIYTSRLLNFKNLPEPQNDNSLEYTRID